MISFSPRLVVEAPASAPRTPSANSTVAGKGPSVKSLGRGRSGKRGPRRPSSSCVFHPSTRTDRSMRFGRNLRDSRKSGRFHPGAQRKVDSGQNQDVRSRGSSKNLSLGSSKAGTIHGRHLHRTADRKQSQVEMWTDYSLSLFRSKHRRRRAAMLEGRSFGLLLRCKNCIGMPKLNQQAIDGAVPLAAVELKFSLEELRDPPKP